MATSKPTVGPTNSPILNAKVSMPSVCPCSYLVSFPVYLYRPLYHLLHRVRIEKHMSDLHLSWVSLFLVSLSFLFLLRLTLQLAA